MRKVIVVEWMTLDGVVQAPGAPDEDRDDGFALGGWSVGYWDELMGRLADATHLPAGGFLSAAGAPSAVRPSLPTPPGECRAAAADRTSPAMATTVRVGRPSGMAATASGRAARRTVAGTASATPGASIRPCGSRTIAGAWVPGGRPGCR